MTHEPQTDSLSELSELMLDEYVPPGRTPPDPRKKRARRRAGIAVATVFAIILATMGGYVAWALAAPLPLPVEAVEPPVSLSPNSVTVVMPSWGAAAVSVEGGDAYLGPEASGVWKTSGTEEPRALASLTKLITALVILDAKPLADANDPGPTITFDEADNDLYDEYYVMGATIAAMPTGSSMSQYDALATMLIPSASNYADVLSTWAFGSRSGFLREAREWLDANGLTSTRIVEPTGIDPDNTSTPAELIALGKIAAANPVIARISATPSVSLPVSGHLVNTNSLLGQSGITGLKTGNLGPGTYNLLYTATVDVGIGEPLRVTGVRLGGDSRWSVEQDVLATLSTLQTGFRPIPVAARGDELGTYTTAWGSTLRIVVGEDASVLTWSDTQITATLDMTTPAVYRDGEVVGTLTWTAGPQTTTADVIIEGTIDEPDAWWRLTNPGILAGR